MQYVLTEVEFQDYQRLKCAVGSLDSDAAKREQYLGGLARLQLSDWQQVSGRIPKDVLDAIDMLHRRSEQRLLKIWEDMDPDYYERELSWARDRTIDDEPDQAQNSEQLAA